MFLQAIIGGPESGDPRGFTSIKSVELLDDGAVWVVDGGGGEGFATTTPYVRRYDAQGNYLGDVSRQGDGPGEFRAPAGVAQLPDGRVVIRDAAPPGKLILFTTDGVLTAEWNGRALGAALRWPMGGLEAPILVSDMGRIWLQIWSGSSQAPRSFIRVSGDGVVLDTVALPESPVVPRDEVEFNEGRGTVRLSAPFSPYAAWTLTPDGWFAVARTDEYAVRFVRPGASAGAPASGVRPTVEHEASAVRVSDAERAWWVRDMVRSVSSVVDAAEREIPRAPEYKPPIRGLRTSDDSRLLVGVSMPSRFSNERWTEPVVFDVFEVDGTLAGRIALPDGFAFHGMRGNSVWGVRRDSLAVQTVQIYRIDWIDRG